RMPSANFAILHALQVVDPHERDHLVVYARIRSCWQAQSANPPLFLLFLQTELAMKIVVLRETQEGEARVALMPESVKKLIALGTGVQVESSAGLNAARTDDEYREAGAEISSDREALLADADVLAVVNRLSANDFGRLKRGAIVIGFLRPLDEPAALLPAV